jgi:ubiquinone/menaquinone biosynthesis C-methylase UbiE
MSSPSSRVIYEMKPPGWWDRVVVPKLICTCCGQQEIMDARQKVVPQANGDVLELGCGGGLNIPFVQTTQIKSYHGLDPSPRLLDASRSAAQAKGLIADIQAGIGEAMPYADASFDTILVTFTLCSVESQAQTLSEMRRVLRPSGKVLFLEHGSAPDASVQRWQRWIEPVWKQIGGGCHLTRPVISAYRDAGFKMAQSDTAYMTKAPRPFGWVEWGDARV